MRNKGKVHPCTSSSSSSSSSSYTPNERSLSVLNVLPAAIFALISSLSAADREVLAYLITRSLKSPNPPFPPSELPKKQSSNPHGFDCGCFDCYTGFWLRWDSSPDRELIHRAIEAFEEHLSSGERVRKGGSGRNRRGGKIGRRKGEMSAEGGGVREVCAVGTPEVAGVAAEEEVDAEEREEEVEGESRAAAGNERRGLARKVLPDVMGIFSSRLWRLWGPEI